MPCDPTSNRRSDIRDQSVKYATGHADKDSQLSRGKYATGKIINKTYIFGTWNVQGLLQAGKLKIIEMELQRYNVEICGLSETHYKQSGHFTTDNNVIYCSSNTDKSTNGVAIIIDKKLNHLISGYVTKSDRIIMVKLDTKPIKTNIIQVYAPTCAAADEIVETFYNQLQEVVDGISKRELVIIMGDMNAKVGRSNKEEHLREVIGKFGLGERNSRGDRLIEFAITNQLTIANTMFQHHPRRLSTWKSPGNIYKNQIDYMLISKRWKSSCINAIVYPGAECGSDHKLLVMKLYGRIKKPTIGLKTQQRLSIAGNNKDNFTNTFDDMVKRQKTIDLYPVEQHWNWLKTIIKSACEKTASPIETKRRKPWFSAETMTLIDERRALKAGTLKTEEQLQTFNKKIKISCKRDKNNFISSICDEIQKHADHNETKDLFGKIKTLTRDFKIKNWAIEDTNGCLKTNFTEIAEVWRGYCQNLYDCFNSAEDNENNAIHPEEPDILRREISDAIKFLKNNKAVGTDGIPAEILKIMGDTGIDELHSLCNSIWKSGIWPREWCRSVYIPLHKKGKSTKCENYRTISLVPHASKIMLRIIHKRIEGLTKMQIPEEQTGFMKGCGTREQILNLRQIIEKCREYNMPAVLCFIDYHKAFDNVIWSKLWLVLTKMGIPDHIVLLIKNLYRNNSNVIRIDKAIQSAEFYNKKGVKQGCILSPVLFNLYGEYIMRTVMHEWNGGISIGGRKISNLRYADDTALITSDLGEMKSLLKKVERISREYGLEINKSKTKVMIIDRERQIKFNGKTFAGFEVVNDFVYLGSLINSEGSPEKEIKRRIEMGRCAMVKLNKIWKDGSINKNVKVKLVKTLIFSIVLYGAETWTLNKTSRVKLNSFEMWCWRKLLRIPWTAKRTNASIAEELNLTQRLANMAIIKVIKYFGHIVRSERNLELLIIQGKIQGTRPKGRPPQRWTDIIKHWSGLTLWQCVQRARNRGAWRKMIQLLHDHDTPLG